MTKEDIYVRLKEVFVNERHRINKGVTISTDLWDIIKPVAVDPITGIPCQGLRFNCWDITVFNAPAAGYKLPRSVFNHNGKRIAIIND